MDQHSLSRVTTAWPGVKPAYLQAALLALRLIVGLFFIAHSMDKFGLIGDGSIHEMAVFFARMDMPVPYAAAPLLAVLEAFGGLALILGVATRAFALLLALVVAGELLVVKLPESINLLGQGGFWMELVLLAGLVVIAVFGPGAFAVEE